MKNNLKITLLALVFVVVLFASCGQPGKNDPGSEYMPDMAHSIAYEANIYNYYYNNTWDEKSVKDLKSLSVPGKPVNGTIPRGYAGVAMSTSPQKRQAKMDMLNGLTSTSAISVPVNGSVPFYYKNTEDERLRATAEIIENPYPITAIGLAQGKELYNIFCGICHGSKGDGVGYLVSEDNPNAKYPAQPANLILGDLLTASNGRYYFAIMHGKNVMGGYADKLSYEERWNVIHHIRSLQASATKATYNEKKNTLNNIEVPGESIRPIASGVHVPGTDEELEPNIDTGIENPTGQEPVHEGHHEAGGDHSHDGGDHSHDEGDH